MKVCILIPVYNDWESISLLLPTPRHELEDRPGRCRVCSSLRASRGSSSADSARRFTESL